jgi:hypothetical protein
MVWDSAQAHNGCTNGSETYCNNVKSHFIGTNRWLKTPPKETAKPAETHWTERLPTRLTSRSRDAQALAQQAQKVSVIAQPRTNNQTHEQTQFDPEVQSWPKLPASKPEPRRTDIEVLANGWEVVRDEDFHGLEKQSLNPEETDENASNDPVKSTDSNSFFNWIWCEQKAEDSNSTAPPNPVKDEAPEDPLSATFSYAEALKR